ncbi:MAG: hypothetical protein EPO47_05160 [Rugosibacter sp.]|nr:MAG: hypothetical protein EPO60_04755 [Rugosibacter sp.]TBR09931.1 MAG: hypothetical protein EPO47_05160 [Rugosibacter sp.]
MPIRFDWKFILTLLFTMASTVVPVWLWQADLSSKALTLTIKSAVDLQPQGLDQLEGIQVSIDGNPLRTPFVSVLELTNTGSRPILAADFEGPLKIAVAKPSVVVKVLLGSATPTSLEPRADLIESLVAVKPLLLNPGDVIRLTVVTADARPEYSIRGRIAGVQKVTVNDAQSASITKVLWLMQVVGTLLLVIYFVSMTEFMYAGIRRRTFLPFPLATGLVTGSGAGLLLIIQSAIEQTKEWAFWPYIAMAVLVSAPILVFRNRQRSAAYPVGAADAHEATRG